MDRRSFLAMASLILGPSFLFNARAAAARDRPDRVDPKEPFPFSFERLCEEMKARAGTAWREPAADLPEKIANLKYDGYRAIRYRPDHALWKGQSSFELQAFHMGWLFPHPVRLNGVENGMATPLVFTSGDFEYRKPLDPDDFENLVMPGTAGFRLHYPLNDPAVEDEVVVFQGASYFRALGRGNLYGLSARGIAVNTATSRGEEFPGFTDFFIEVPKPGAKEITVHAALDGPSMTGAYAFRIVPGQDTRMDVRARLYLREDVERLGIAPMTSMFLFGENNRHAFDDFRGEVHDSDGLKIVRASGEEVWRSLNNPSQLANSFFAEENPTGFGLFQRDRNYEDYQDGAANYHRRPSVLVEPLGEWGRGAISLVEIPTDLEINDNVVAFWTPDGETQAGDELAFDYRLVWGAIEEADDRIARVVGLRTGEGGVSGLEKERKIVGERKFVIDFRGKPLEALPASAKVEATVNVAGAGDVRWVVSRIEANGDWRLAIDLMPDGDDPIELSANLEMEGRILSETWHYQWRRNDGKSPRV